MKPRALVKYALAAACVLPAALATAAETGRQPLGIEVFMSSEDHMGLGVASTIIYGDKEAVLVDAQFTNANAHRVVAQLYESGRDLTYVYITHEHVDHWLGLPIVKQAFPGARVVSHPSVAAAVNASLAFNLDYWGVKALGRNGAKTTVAVEALADPVIMLEGRELRIVPLTGDAAHSSVVWIPSIRTLVAGDTVYDHAHAWLADAKSPALRQAWLDTLDRLDALEPEVVVPGHAPSADYLSPDSIDYTRRYIESFIARMKETDDSGELIETMNRIYPDLSCGFCLDYSARILKDGLVWEGQWPPSLREMKAR